MGTFVRWHAIAASITIVIAMPGVYQHPTVNTGVSVLKVTKVMEHDVVKLVSLVLWSNHLNPMPTSERSLFAPQKVIMFANLISYLKKEEENRFLCICFWENQSVFNFVVVVVSIIIIIIIIIIIVLFVLNFYVFSCDIVTCWMKAKTSTIWNWQICSKVHMGRWGGGAFAPHLVWG